MKFDTEEKLVDKVENCLKENGIGTWREVVPDQCENWEKPYRVDLIFRLPTGELVGVEAKNTNTLGSGGVLASAVTQIENKYMNKTYFKGCTISQWCILAPSDIGWAGGEDEITERLILSKVEIFVRNFLKKKFNIELLRYLPARQYCGAAVDIFQGFRIGGISNYGK